MKRLVSLFTKDIKSTITRALKLKPRGGIRNDQLSLLRLAGQVRVEWSARGVHPWDRDQSASARAALFLQQALEDADAAITELLKALPTEIERIEIRVFDPLDREKIILAGIVDREDVCSIRAYSSLTMRLKMLGIHYSSIRGDSIEGLTIAEAENVVCA